MAATRQDFSLYQGDDIAPIFTARNSDGDAIDISSVTQIEWMGYRDEASAPALDKKKTTGGITFVSNGSDGQFQVTITKADTVALDWGWYFHSVVLDDASGNSTTIAVGRFAVLQRGERV